MWRNMRKHPGSCTFAEAEPLNYSNPKSAIQNEKYGQINPNNSHNYHDENHDEMELHHINSKKSTQWHSTPVQRTAQKQSHSLQPEFMETKYKGHIRRYGYTYPW